jgi:hypothetical protein
MDTGVLDFFNKKLIQDYYFCLKSGPVFLFQIFIIAMFIIHYKSLVEPVLYYGTGLWGHTNWREV